MARMSATLSRSSVLEIEPMANGFGALLRGIDFDRLDAALGDRLNQALNRHGVLFYRPGADNPVSNDQFVALAETMGDVIRYPYRRGENYPDERLGKIDTDARAINRFGTSLWHTDGTSEECPPQAAMLSPEELPAQGGDTMWADMVAAYEALSPDFRRFLDGLEALHTTEIPARRSGEPEVYGKGSQFIHPVVLTDPSTGRRMLYVNEHYTERVIGLSEAESASLLRLLYNHSNTPEFHVRWAWQLHDIVIWEERLTQHRAVANFDGPRVLRRAAIKGDRPR
jgi:taurine dioxygenase